MFANRYLLLLLLSLALVAPAQAAHSGWDRSHAGQSALVGITFQDENGVVRRLGEFRGKVLLLNFWATWCPPCIKEMPDIAQLQAKYGEKGFKVIALSQDASIQSVKDFFKKNGIVHIIPFLDKGTAAFRMAKINGLPTTIIFDRNLNEIARTSSQVSPNDPILITMIEDALAK